MHKRWRDLSNFAAMSLAVAACASVYVYWLAEFLTDGTRPFDFVAALLMGVLSLLGVLLMGGAILHKLPEPFMLAYLSMAAVGCLVAGAEGVKKLQRNQFQPATILFDRCVQASYPPHIYKQLCADGEKSMSTGQGTCSWHGGVIDSLPAPDRTMTNSECWQQAESVSWID